LKDFKDYDEGMLMGERDKWTKKLKKCKLSKLHEFGPDCRK
jgi:hypothetical protein